MSDHGLVCGRDVWEAWVGPDRSTHMPYESIKFKGGWDRLAAKFNELQDQPGTAIAVLKEANS